MLSGLFTLALVNTENPRTVEHHTIPSDLCVSIQIS